MAFVTRNIAVSLRLASGSLTASGENVVDLGGHKCDLVIENAGGELSKANAQLRIYGMRFSDMSKFSTRGMNPMQQRNDEIVIRAGDANTGMAEVFSGTICYAIPTMSGAPDISLDINAVPGQFYQMNPAAANSYPGAASVAEIVSGLAKQMGFTFENHGVTTKLSDHYLRGTLMYQLEDVVAASGIICHIEKGTVRIWPRTSAPDTQTILLSSATGLIGYPSFNRTGVVVEMEFRNDITRGRKVELRSSVPGASGAWFVNYMRHELSTQTHQGSWKTVAFLAPEGLHVA